MRGRTVCKTIGTLGGALFLAFALARAGRVEPVRPVNPFASDKVSVAGSPQKKSDTVSYRADYMRAAWGEKKTATLKGNVMFTSGDTKLSSEQVEWDKEAQTAVSPGKIRITNSECDINGNTGAGYFKKRLGVIEGNVVMLLKPKKAEGEKADKDNIRAKLNEFTTVSCKKVEYLYRKKIATASGGVLFKQPKRTANSDSATYDQTKELLTLTGHVQATDENGQTFATPGKVVISLKKGDEWMEAQDATASFKVENDGESQ